MLLNVKMHQNPSVHCCFFLSVFLTVTFALVLLRFPSSHKVSVRSLDVSDSILNLPLILQRHIDSSMTATLIGKSDLLFFVSKISTGQTGRAFHFAPLLSPPPPSPWGYSVTHTGTQLEGSYRFLCLHHPCTPLYLSLLAHHCPLNLFYVITWHQSYLLTLIRGKIEPVYFLNMAYSCIRAHESISCRFNCISRTWNS